VVKMQTFNQFLIENDGIHLWLDDERDPKSKDAKEKSGALGDEVWVKTPAEAIKWLETGQVTSISLDNDLGLEPGNEGFRVADYIEAGAANGTLPRLQWKIHSGNSARWQHMIKALQNANKYWSEHEQKQ